MQPDSRSAVATDDHKASKICAVCGDKALGYNFNAITCESCKAFFRRNALKNKEFNCPFNNNCDVTVITRRFCQKCRLQKCFDIGMKKESILSDEEKLQKWQKIKENRIKKQQVRAVKEPRSDSGSNSPSSTSHLSNSTGTRHQSRVLSTSAASSDGESSQPPKRIKFEKDSEITSQLALPVLVHEENSSQGYGNDFSPPTTTSEAHFGHGAEFLTTYSDHTALTSTSGPYSTAATSITGNTVTRSGSLTSNTMTLSNIPQNLVVTNGDKMVAYPVGTPLPYLGLSATHEEVSYQTSQALGVHSGDVVSGCLDNLDDVVAIAIKAEFHTTTLEGKGQKELNDREKSRLEELFIASRSLVEPVELEHPIDASEPNNLISVINMTDIAIKRIIRMAKKINSFISMCQEDQIALLKGGCTELMILRSVFNYDPDKNSWRLPTKGRPRELRMDILKEASQLGVNLYEEHQRFVNSFDPKWRSDENILLLLSAIALFSPERCNVKHKDVVKLEQDTYYYLLRRYLETVCTGCDSRSVYLNLIGKLVDLHRLNESHIQLFLEVNPKHVEPLLIEIFDLNPAYR